MKSEREFVEFDQFDPTPIAFSVHNDKEGKTRIRMNKKFGIHTPACVTHWPQCSGDGNFGSKFGPDEVGKAKFMIDLNDTPIKEKPNEGFALMREKFEKLDDRLLDFVTDNQVRILSRKNLDREQIKMLQIRTVRPKYNMEDGEFMGHRMSLSKAKFSYEGKEQKIQIVDCNGEELPDGVVGSGDVVTVMAYPASVYTIGDKFGIKWEFNAVAIICQAARLPPPSSTLELFKKRKYEDLAMEYVSAAPDAQFNSEQFGD